MTAPTLTTDRLILRLPEAGDGDAYARFFADAEASHFYGGPLRRDQAFGILCRDIGHWILKGFGKFVMTRDGATIGGCGIVHPDGWPGHELTWWLLPEARGAGIAQEASRAVLGWARAHLGRATVETHFRDENTAARRLTEALGGGLLRRETFPDGIDRDVYGLPTGEVRL
ncbi:GNAT family N-acetyltransferase [Paracoccus marinaquae]|uniref:GNAT family N-acetyltransferase n=1 Tax=Paracoccus marinaquae TaxID=2841926 RepID=A0ABS6AG61_9RHOB|nr:GNAT family N-acetyltransferase [Paracoccus marinaquae]MBU3028675.1 GNAT family N-acetyltransferase [Paracoccus marinaquae]